MNNTNELLYMVRQTQPSAGYDKTTIYIYANEEDANRVARKLNKKYGANCEFTEEYDFIAENDDVDYDEIHYYDVKAIRLNEKLAPFYT